MAYDAPQSLIAMSAEPDDNIPPMDPTQPEEHASAAAEDSADAADSLSARVDKLSSQSNFKGRFSHRGEIGRGGMGAVLEVYDCDLRRSLAMKVLLGQRAGEGAEAVEPGVLLRFLEEAQVTGQLDHPGVVPVHELGVDEEGRAYFTMPLIKGDELRRIFELVHEGREGWTVTRALGVLLKVCEAMAFAHDKGIVHRDLKPANIMVGKYGEVYVMDWGLARVVGKGDTAESATGIRTDLDEVRRGDESSLLVTMDGSVAGTPSYMPPEQARGRLAEIGPHSDVYAVGAMLYHLLTGRMPYDTPDSDCLSHTVLGMVMEGPPAPVRQLANAVPAELEAICEKAMYREPSRRYANMSELKEELAAYLENRVVKAYRTGALAELKKWVVRNRALAGTIAAALVLVLVALGVISGLFLEVRDQRNNARSESKRALRQTHLAHLTTAQLHLEAGRRSEARRVLEQSPREFRGWVWRHLMLGLEPSLWSVRMQASSVAFSPDGEYVVTGGRTTAPRVWHTETGEPHAVFGDTDDSARWDDYLGHTAFSADGQRIIAAHTYGSIRVWDFTSGELLHERRHTSDGYSVPKLLATAFRPDSAQVLVLGIPPTTTGQAGKHTFELRDDRDGSPIETPLNLASLEPPVAFSPVEALLAAGSRQPGNWPARSHVLVLWNPETGRKVDELDVLAQCVAFSWDGSRLATASYDRSSAPGTSVVQIWDRTTGENLQTFRGHERFVECVAFSPDGRLLASGSRDRTLRLWSIETGKLLSTFAGHGAVSSVAFHPKGQLIASKDSVIRVLDVSNGDPELELPGRPEGLSVVSFGRDGAEILAGTQSGVLWRWEARTGEPLEPLRGHGAAILCLASSPDGRFIVAGCEDGALCLWLADRGELLGSHRGHEKAVQAVAFTADGGRVVSGAGDGSVVVWDPATVAPQSTTVAYQGFGSAWLDPADGDLVVAISRDGRRLVSGAESDIWLVSSAELPSLNPDVTYRDSKGEVVGFRSSQQVWDPVNETLLACLDSPVPWRTVAVSAKGRKIAASQGSLRVWSAETGQHLFDLREDGSPIRALRFSPDGNTLVSGTEDGGLQLWDTNEGVLLCMLMKHKAPVLSVAFSPDGKRVLSGSEDGAVRIWESDVSQAREMWHANEKRNPRGR